MDEMDLSFWRGHCYKGTLLALLKNIMNDLVQNQVRLIPTNNNISG